MKKLTLSEWSSIAEIVASIVIVASLLYVGLELNQNTQALQQTSFQSVLQILSEGEMALATDDELLDAVLLVEQAPTDASERDWRKFTHFAYPRIGMWEYLYLGHRENAISSVHWLSIEPYFFAVICLPGYQRFWKENQFGFSSEFIDYVETNALPRCDGR